MYNFDHFQDSPVQPILNPCLWRHRKTRLHVSQTWDDDLKDWTERFILRFWQKTNVSDLYFLPDSFPATMLSQPVGSDSDSDVEDHVPLKRALKARIDSDSDWYNRRHLSEGDKADFARSNWGVEIDISCTCGKSSFNCMQIIIFTMVIMKCQLTWLFYKLGQNFNNVVSIHAGRK